MDKQDTGTIIALLQEIKDASQHQAQYLQEIRNAIAGDPLKASAPSNTAHEVKRDRPNQNLFDNVRAKNNMD